MDKIGIEGVTLTPLKIIRNPKGDIFHGLKKTDPGFSGFGEAYFSTIRNGQIKGWNKHKRMTLNLIVPKGRVKIVIVDIDNQKFRKNNIFEAELSPKNYQRLTIPPGLWVAFKSKTKGVSIILNIANIEHDTSELEKLDLDQIDYKWDSF